MIGAMAWLYRVTGQTGYREAAQRAWAYLERVHLHDGVLAATSRNNLSRGTGFLEDYAFCAFGLLLLYDATLDQAYLRQAEALCQKGAGRLPRPRRGLFLTPKDERPFSSAPRTPPTEPSPAATP